MHIMRVENTRDGDENMIRIFVKTLSTHEETHMLAAQINT